MEKKPVSGYAAGCFFQNSRHSDKGDGMQVILGRYMDGGAWPDAVTAFGGGRNAVDGVKICGPAGFLSVLEEKLGLPGREDAAGRRTAAWEARLARHVPAEPEEGEPFYAASFRVDGWNTAKRLIAMRDELKDAGALEGGEAALWKSAGACAAAGLFRLAALFSLEAEGGPDEADRVPFLCAYIREWGMGGLEELRLAEPRSCWSRSWNALFDALVQEGVRLHEAKEPACDALKLPGESFRLEAENPSEAALALAAVLGREQRRGAPGRVLIIRREEDGELDTALHAFGLPGTGCRRRSAARPADQLFSLYLRVSLSAFEPELLRQLLLLPLCPLEETFAAEVLAALRFSEVLPERGKDWSGVSAWPKAWRNLLEEDGEGTCPLSARERREALEWIVPEKRMDAEEEGLAARARACAAKLRRWAAEEAAERPELAVTAAHCRALEQLLEGTETLTRRRLDMLIDDVTGRGERSAPCAEERPWIVLASPGQLWEAGGPLTVIWWNCVDSDAPAAGTAWSCAERAWLEARGVLPEGAALRLRARNAAMRRPFLYAERLILVTPRTAGGEETSPHPVMALLKEEGLRRVKAQSVLAGKGGAEGGAFWAVDMQELPAPVPVLPWEGGAARPLSLPAGLSPSSLKTLLGCPLRWYLENSLGIRDGGRALQGDAALLGTLAHSVVEELFMEYGEGMKRMSLTQEEMFRRLQRAAKRQAARFSLPERQVLLHDMAARLVRSVRELCRFLEREKLLFLDTERSYEGELEQGVAYRGRYDMAFARPGAPEEPAVLVDLKWSSSDVFFREMKEGSVQLASYRYLLRHGTLQQGKRAAPASRLHRPAGHDIEEVCYFLMKKADMVRSSEDSPLTLDEQWAAVAARWKKLRACLAAGELLSAPEWACRLAEEEDEEACSKAAAAQAASVCRYCMFPLLCGRKVEKGKDVA